MVVQLDFGSLRYKKDGKEEEFAVLGGFAEILRDSVNVFAEGADLADEIDEEESLPKGRTWPMRLTKKKKNRKSNAPKNLFPAKTPILTLSWRSWKLSRPSPA